MTDKGPLNVRCAEALGWECQERKSDHGARSRWVGIESGGSWMWGGYHVPPYGDDTPAGWACTGPLMDRFDLHTETLHQNGLIYAWRERQGDEPDICGPNAPHRCAAIAEWVARYGKEALDASRTA